MCMRSRLWSGEDEEEVLEEEEVVVVGVAEEGRFPLEGRRRGETVICSASCVFEDIAMSLVNRGIISEALVPKPHRISLHKQLSGRAMKLQSCRHLHRAAAAAPLGLKNNMSLFLHFFLYCSYNQKDKLLIIIKFWFGSTQLPRDSTNLFAANLKCGLCKTRKNM